MALRRDFRAKIFQKFWPERETRGWVDPSTGFPEVSHGARKSPKTRLARSMDLIFVARYIRATKVYRPSKASFGKISAKINNFGRNFHGKVPGMVTPSGSHFLNNFIKKGLFYLREAMLGLHVVSSFSLSLPHPRLRKRDFELRRSSKIPLLRKKSQIHRPSKASFLSLAVLLRKTAKKVDPRQKFFNAVRAFPFDL